MREVDARLRREQAVIVQCKEDPAMICPKCGTTEEKPAATCEKCGYDMNAFRKSLGLPPVEDEKK